MTVNRDPNTGFGQSVNIEGQAITLSEVQTEARHVAEEGKLFLFASNIIPLTTTGSFSAVFLIKNGSTSKDLHVGKLRTCGNVLCEWLMYHTITAGTLLTDEAAGLETNMLIGSTTPFNGDIYSGGDLKTVTGILMASWINNAGHSQPDLDGALILPPLSSIAFAAKPAAAGDVCLTIEAWQTDT